MKKLVISPNGDVVLDGNPVSGCLGASIRIDPANPMEVELRIAVDEVDVEYSQHLVRGEHI